MRGRFLHVPHPGAAKVAQSTDANGIFNQTPRVAEVGRRFGARRAPRNRGLRGVEGSAAVGFLVANLILGSLRTRIQQIAITHENALAHRVVLPFDPARVSKRVPCLVVFRAFVFRHRVAVDVHLVEHVSPRVRRGADVETQTPRLQSAANRIEAHDMQELILAPLRNHHQHVDAHGAVHAVTHLVHGSRVRPG